MAQTSDNSLCNMHQTNYSSVNPRLRSLSKSISFQSRPSQQHPPISTMYAPSALCRSSGQVLGEEQVEPTRPPEDQGDGEQGLRHLQDDSVFRIQLMTTLWYIYLLFSQLRRYQTQSGRTFDPVWSETLPATSDVQDSSRLLALESANNCESDKAVVLSGYHNHLSTSLVPCPQADEPTRNYSMAEASGASRHTNNAAIQSSAERIYERMMQHKDYKPGKAYDGVNVTANGYNFQGSVTNGQTQGASNYYGPTTVSGMNFQGDMPPELAREFMMLPYQQQQQQQRQPPPPQQVGPSEQQPRYRVLGGKQIPLPSNVPASAGTGHSPRN